MRVAERMRRNPPSIHAADGVGRAARLLAHEGLRAVPVMSRGALLGMLGEADVATAHPSAATTLSVGEIGARLDRLPAERVIATTVTAVGPRTPLSEAIRLMRARGQPVLPVVRGRELVGVLAEEDLLELLADLLESESRFVTIR